MKRFFFSAFLAGVAALALGVALGGCKHDGSSCTGAACADGGTPDGGGEVHPVRMCRAGNTWSPGGQAFQDSTGDWGLPAENAHPAGVVDIDGDGYMDIVVDTGGYARGGGKVYMNRLRGGRRVFVDETHMHNLLASRMSDQNRYWSVITFGDVNNDGAPDAFVDEQDYPPAGATIISDGPDVMINDGHGNFSLTNDPQIVGPSRPLTVGAFLYDQNLDGNLDVAIGYWYIQPPFMYPYGQQPQLFRGDGAAGFTDATAAAGMTLLYTAASVAAGTNARPLFSIAMCDINDDGRMEIAGAAYARSYNELFVANGDTYTEDARARGVASDDRMDYHDDQSYLCYCQMHATDAYCMGAARPAPGICAGFGGTVGRGWYPGVSDQPYNLGGNTFTYVCEDYDNDGDFDLYETNIKHADVGSSSDPSEILVNDGTGHFTRPGREMMGLVPPIDLTRVGVDEGGQQGAAFDFDNDGRMDIMLMGSPYPMNAGWFFHHKSDGPLSFEYIGTDAGFNQPCANGMLIADFDHDGDQDMIVGTYGCNDQFTAPNDQPMIFYENISTQGNWVSVKVRGLGGAGHANASGIGARVKLTAGGVTQTRLIHNSWGQGPEAEDTVAWFGLGSTCDIDSIEVRWPNASLTTQTFTGVISNYRVELREGDSTVHYLP